MSQTGQCVWFDLFSNQIEKTKAFYSELFNWSTEEMDTPSGPYTIFKSQGKSVGGLTRPWNNLIENKWLAYVSVANLDQAVQTIQNNGGKILAPEVKMKGVGRWVIASDPQGALFSAFDGSAESQQCSQDPVFGNLGQFCWHELMCQDYSSALSFYEKVFGWKKTTSVDMGPMGIYQLYAAGEKDLGGMMNITPEMNTPNPYWLEYVYVSNVDETVTRAKQLGGKSTFPAMDIGGGAGRIAGLVDSQGAPFAIYTNKS